MLSTRVSIFGTRSMQRSYSRSLFTCVLNAPFIKSLFHFQDCVNEFSGNYSLSIRIV